MNFGATYWVWNFSKGGRRAPTAPARPPPPDDGPLRGRLQRPVGHALLPGSLRGARIPDQVQSAAPGGGARSPRGELLHICRRSHTEPDGRQEGEDPGADSDGHRRGQPLPGRGGEASRPGLFPDTGGVRVSGQSGDQGHLRQRGGHGGLVGGFALHRPHGGFAVAGQDHPGDQATVHPLRRQGHRGRPARSDTRRGMCRTESPRPNGRRLRTAGATSSGSATRFSMTMGLRRRGL